MDYHQLTKTFIYIYYYQYIYTMSIYVTMAGTFMKHQYMY